MNLRKRPRIIINETKVPKYELPNPLICLDGTKVSDMKIWFNKRRSEILNLFNENVYGKMPGRTDKFAFEIKSIKKNALAGKATLKEITISLENNKKIIRLNVLIFLPNNQKKPYPTLLGLNFYGNHTINQDPDITLPDEWVPNNNEYGITQNKAIESSRGIRASKWLAELIIKRGYALATLYNGDIDPDFDDDFKNGVHPLFYKEGQLRPKENEWGAIGAWAWGLSRVMDYFERDSDIDHKRVIVLGHSRLGKTALWAGANDQRFAIVVSNNSGCGGAALFRRKFGETIYNLNKYYPHWFCKNFKIYDERESELPIDQHMLISLIAPRPVYIASAQKDFWSDPKGEFLGAKYADPVYKLLGTNGLNITKIPKLNQPVLSTIGYHIRSGDHDLTKYDLDRYIDFANMHFKNS
ncbi:MAG: glucuronyl esterase domain-containing protein [Promethearchaeota archaeon]